MPDKDTLRNGLNLHDAAMATLFTLSIFHREAIRADVNVRELTDYLAELAGAGFTGHKADKGAIHQIVSGIMRLYIND